MSFSVDLSGKRALVTGASSGFGRHFSQVLARCGAHVIAAARRVDVLESIVDAIRANGGSAKAVAMDVTRNDSIEAAFAAAGDVDILINNAGISSGGPSAYETAENYDHVVGTNLRGAYFVATAAARNMIARKSGGSIVNIASILGLRQQPGLCSYAIAKAGLVQMTKQHALEWARYKIRVNAIAPGYIFSEMSEEFFKTEAGLALINRIPMRRYGLVTELEGPMLLLASEAGSFMTGSVIEADGGHLVTGL